MYIPQNVSVVLLAMSLQQRMAEEILTRFKELPEAWTQADSILERSNSQKTKYFALQILEALIKTKWKALPREQCEGKRSVNGNNYDIPAERHATKYCSPQVSVS